MSRPVIWSTLQTKASRPRGLTAPPLSTGLIPMLFFFFFFHWELRLEASFHDSAAAGDVVVLVVWHVIFLKLNSFKSKVHKIFLQKIKVTKMFMPRNLTQHISLINKWAANLYWASYRILHSSLGDVDCRIMVHFCILHAVSRWTSR